MRRTLLLLILTAVVSSAVTYLACRGDVRPIQTGREDPGWHPGTQLRVNHSDPITDRYSLADVEIVRVIEADGSIRETADGPTNAPRAEWRFTFPDSGRTYVAVSR